MQSIDSFINRWLINFIDERLLIDELWFFLITYIHKGKCVRHALFTTQVILKVHCEPFLQFKRKNTWNIGNALTLRGLLMGKIPKFEKFHFIKDFNLFIATIKVFKGELLFPAPILLWHDLTKKKEPSLLIATNLI